MRKPWPFAKLVALIKPKRRWAQFSLATMFVLVTICAVPCTWLAWKMDHKRRERAAVAELEMLGATIRYAEPTDPSWLRWVLGNDFFSHVVYVFLPPCRDAYEEKHFGMYLETQFTDGPAATDDDLRSVAAFDMLKELDLTYADIGDAGLSRLRGLTNLRSLDLFGTNITNNSTATLQGMTWLERLDVGRTHVTKEAIVRLKKALPNCQIIRRAGQSGSRDSN